MCHKTANKGKTLRGKCKSSYLELRRPPLQQQSWGLCVHRLREGIKTVNRQNPWNLNYIVGCFFFWVPGLGKVSASLLRLVRLSAPSWFRIPGNISVSCLFSACPVIVKVLAAREAWTFGLLKWITVPWFVNIFTYCGKKTGIEETVGGKCLEDDFRG